ncbi:hypothetical protein [Methylocapsa acidiphila]|uniref:hypothetical protein n=1 Tax=Methylocapsa acidiphila TaxID=133552 RepID=UPI00047AFE7B|nr:hypothetical protein [Methylocapsa acidiphila]
MYNMYLYLQSFLMHLWPLLTAGSFWGFGSLAHTYWPWAKRQLDRVPSSMYQTLTLNAFILAFFYSGFAVWSDEHEARIKSEEVFQRIPTRMLKPSQRSRMEPLLNLDLAQSYSLEVNSVPNCDECEQFAENIREFFNSIPGWKASGSVAFCCPPFPSGHGLYLLTKEEEKHSELAEKLFQAFEAGGALLTRESNPGASKGTLMILVARTGA